MEHLCSVERRIGLGKVFQVHHNDVVEADTMFREASVLNLEACVSS